MDYKNATSKMGITPLYGKIKNANELICMDILNLYSGEMAANHNKTYHEYISRLPPIVREQFNVIKKIICENANKLYKECKMKNMIK